MSEIPLVNRVANSGIIVINLEDQFPEREIVEFDIKPYLFKELILKEKDFRQSLKDHNWDSLRNKTVLVFNSNDAIIPVWAYMLVASYLKGVASEIFIGDKEAFLTAHYSAYVAGIDAPQYDEKRVVIKGCSERAVPASAYALLTAKLKPYAQSIMYGEPCSTVPIFKRPRKLS